MNMQNMDLRKAINALKTGKIIVYPTDTLYALGADVFNADAVTRIFKVKQRPTSEALPVAVSSLEMIEDITVVDEVSRIVIQHLLPGPLTIVLKRRSGKLDNVSGGLDTLAIRIPKNQVALELLSQVGPLTVTSANIHAQQPPRDILGIKQQLRNEKIAVYLDVGTLEGKPSTIVDCRSGKPRVLRKGVITEKDIQDAITNG